MQFINFHCFVQNKGSKYLIRLDVKLVAGKTKKVIQLGLQLL